MESKTDINVPLQIRTHELAQLQSMLPDVRDGLEQAGLDEQAETIDRIYTDHVEGVEATYPVGPEFAAHVSMTTEDWIEIVRFIRRLSHTSEGQRAWWLQKKLADRLKERLEDLE